MATFSRSASDFLPRDESDARGRDDRKLRRPGRSGLREDAAVTSSQPNILLLVSDQERQRSWLPPSIQLPWRERLIAEGLEFTRYFTHSSPCSPSRASLMTGQYVPQHGVVDNVIWPQHKELDPQTPTTGSLLADAGYRSSYIGKWHLSYGPNPPM